MVRNSVAGIIVWLLVIVLLPSLLWAGDAGIPPGLAPRPGAYLLTVDGPLVSLRAQEASLKTLLEDLGRQMGIEVVAHISRAQTLTLAFDRLSVEEALERFRDYANIVYVKDSPEADGKIRRVIAIPQQAGARTGAPARSVREDPPNKESSRLAPFQFTFDPAQHEQKPQ